MAVVGLIILSGLRLLGVVRSGLAGLPELEGGEITLKCFEDDSISISTGESGAEEGVSLVSLELIGSGGRVSDLTESLFLSVLSLLLCWGG